MEVKAVRPAGIENVFRLEAGQEELLATLSSQKEDAIEHGGRYYRPWNPATSKLSSLILKGMRPQLHARSRVLYLGAASGTTVMHVADIAADGVVFAVEFAPRPARDLLRAVEGRPNVVPIVADARRPERYPPFIDRADFLYQDVAQPDQADIAIINAEKYLPPGSHALIIIKARSVSAAGTAQQIFASEIARLETTFTVLDKVSLEPLHRDHLAVLCRY